MGAERWKVDIVVMLWLSAKDNSPLLSLNAAKAARQSHVIIVSHCHLCA